MIKAINLLQVNIFISCRVRMEVYFFPYVYHNIPEQLFKILCFCTELSWQLYLKLIIDICVSIFLYSQFDSIENMYF